MKQIKQCVFILVLTWSFASGQQSQSPQPSQRPDDVSQFVLGPEDQIKIWALGVEEITDKPIRIDPSGDIDLPLVGRVHAAGLTVEQLKSALVAKLAKEVREPRVSIDIVEFGSQPVSVMGAVNHPGVLQVNGRKTLAEILALAGGLRPDAGPYVKITRQNKWGEIPLSNTKADKSGNFQVAQVPVRELLSATNPSENISIRPNDVVTVPSAEMVYVVGAVKKAGGFPLNERESVSVLQALSMAEGLGPTPKAQDSKILRTVSGDGEVRQIPVDLRKVMTGKAEDLALRPNDILFVPDSTAKKAGIRAIEAAIQTATGVVIWHGL
ncbi:MAG TPA: polysaccharide biosynthesis/export family protein [Bryobacteraceae bacterium]|nr:polysaccharide biosynthesis/export family protein [Bryobacteraceae bacterium]